MKLLPTADCYKFFSVDTGKACRQSYIAVLIVQPVQRSKMNAVVVDQEFEQLVVEHEPGRPAPVHKDTGMLGRQACMLFALVYEASADGEAAV